MKYFLLENFYIKKSILMLIKYRFNSMVCKRKLDLVPYCLNHFCNSRIKRIFRHFCINYYEHISCFSFHSSSFSTDFELGSWFCSSFYLKLKNFSIDSFYWNTRIIEKIKKWYFDCFCDIKVWDFFFWFFLSWLLSLLLLLLLLLLLSLLLLGSCSSAK